MLAVSDRQEYEAWTVFGGQLGGEEGVDDFGTYFFFINSEEEAFS